MRYQGYSISNDMYADLKQGETTEYHRDFYAGTDYIIVALSNDDDVKDVDVIIYNDDGYVYTKDTDSKSVAFIKIRPLITRQLKVVVKNYQSGTPKYSSRCRFIIAYK